MSGETYSHYQVVLCLLFGRPGSPGPSRAAGLKYHGHIEYPTPENKERLNRGKNSSPLLARGCTGEKKKERALLEEPPRKESFRDDVCSSYPSYKQVQASPSFLCLQIEIRRMYGSLEEVVNA